MSNRRRGSVRRGLLATPLAAVACVVLLLPAGAGAATVVNGDFEAGTLTGWTVVNPGEFEAGSWFAYSGTAAPTEEGEPGARQVPPPPQGNFAAITDQGGEGLHILYQDIAIEPALSQTLSMLVYYHSYAEITVPSPDTLSPESSANQQYRIDVMKPSAPIDSVNPADILTTVFRANTGDPEELSPKLVTANLTPFGGQTVRLRLAEVDNQFYFNAGTDAVSISTVPLPPPPSNVFTFGKLKLNKKKGTGALLVNVPGPGTLTVVDGGSSGAAASSVASASKKKKALIKSTTVTATAAGLATVNLKPTGAGKKILKSKHKLRFKVLVTFTPTGGAAATQTFRGTLKKKPKPKPKPKRG